MLGYNFLVRDGNSFTAFNVRSLLHVNPAGKGLIFANRIQLSSYISLYNSLLIDISSMTLMPFNGFHMFYGEPSTQAVAFMRVDNIEKLYSFVKEALSANLQL